MPDLLPLLWGAMLHTGLQHAGPGGGTCHAAHFPGRLARNTGLHVSETYLHFYFALHAQGQRNSCGGPCTSCSTDKISSALAFGSRSCLRRLSHFAMAPCNTLFHSTHDMVVHRCSRHEHVPCTMYHLHDGLGLVYFFSRLL